jgi:quinoprotein glucose dehydrogenase
MALLGRDAWSSRYSPLDQINAANFNSLQIAWQFKVGDMFGETNTSLDTALRERQAHQRRWRQAGVVGLNPRRATSVEMQASEGIRYQKSPRPSPGRGLAYWTDGTNERALVVTPGYHLVALDAKTGVPIRVRQGRRRRPDGGSRLSARALAVDDDGPIIREGYPARKARPGETWDPVKKIGADGTVGIDPALGQLGASSPPIVVGDILIVGNSAIHG